MEVNGQLQAPAICTHLGEPQRRLGHGAGEKNCFCWESNIGYPTTGLVTVLTELTLK
jgi:hypothetical protein